MRILYGVCGEGFGHSSRAKEIIHYLQGRGHSVKVVTYGQAYPILKEEEFDVFKVEGLHIAFRGESVQILETVKQNLLKMVQNLRYVRPLRKMMEEFQPDFCISDMEVLVPILSFWYHLPLISIDNQHRLTNLKLDVPSRYWKEYVLAKLVVHGIVGKADWYIVTSFAQTQIIKKHTLLVPPILRKEILDLKKEVKQSDKILVYLTKPREEVLEVLRKCDEAFVVYGFGKRKRERGIIYKEAGEGFLQDLKKCKAIVATAGFTLMSEALFLQKPYFALPLKGQFEQVLNALFLKQAGYGVYVDDLKELEGQLRNFLASLPRYRKKLQQYHPNHHKIFKALDYVVQWVKKNQKQRKKSGM